jgi:hypothetical protein
MGLTALLSLCAVCPSMVDWSRNDFFMVQHWAAVAVELSIMVDEGEECLPERPL